MAATAISPSTVYLNTKATFPIRLGTSILRPSESKRLVSVRYNHKPRLDRAKNVKCSIKTHESKEENSLELSLRDGEREYAYLGKDVSGGDQYVLLTKGSGKDMEMVLEKIGACHEFNLSRMPDERSANKLASRYPRLPEDDEGEKDLLSDGDPFEEEPPDLKNPFDYRNYLKARGNKAKDNAAETSRSGASTRHGQQRPASTTPHSRPSKRSEDPLMAQKKRKAQDNTKTNPKRVKGSTEPPAPKPTTAPTGKDIPKLRMDRKASLHLAPLDDSGELIVENETPVQEKPRSAMSLALSGQLGQGPISLHSAASSPASRVASPMPPRPEHIEEGEEFELGENSSPEPPKKPPAEDDDDADEEDEDADADVEDLELPSPAQVHRQPQRRSEDAVEEKIGGDDEDDLDKQLALAMAEEDEGEVPPPAAPAESDEESEEE